MRKILLFVAVFAIAACGKDKKPSSSSSAASGNEPGSGDVPAQAQPSGILAATPQVSIEEFCKKRIELERKVTGRRELEGEQEECVKQGNLRLAKEPELAKCVMACAMNASTMEAMQGCRAACTPQSGVGATGAPRRAH